MVTANVKRLLLSLILCLAFGFVFVSVTAKACNVPVFRYALERWKADPYEVIIFHRGPITGADKDVLDHLQKFTGTAKMPPILSVDTIDLDKSKDPQVLKIFEKQQKEKKAKLPWMMVFYPRASRIPEPMWAGRLNGPIVENLIASPVRKTIATRILKGQTAVAIFVDSGDKKKDDEAVKILETSLKALPKKLKLPELKKDDPADLLQTDEKLVPLKIEFSMIRVSRTDVKEQMLVNILQSSEGDLPNDQPMVFFIYGRGRSLFAFVGPGITPENIERAGAFLCGPCSCEIKRDNPGFDVMFYVDWEGGVKGRYVTPSDPPPLRSLRPKPKTNDKK